MNPPLRISMEELNAYLDGELAPADAERVVAALGADPALREEACSLRALHEQLRHAYDVPSRAPCRAAVARACPSLRWPHALAAMLLLCCGIVLGWFGHDWQDGGGTAVREGRPALRVAADPLRLVLHVGDFNPARIDALLADSAARLAAAERSGRPLHLEIVANSVGLDLLRVAATRHAAALAELRRNYPERFTLIACGQGLQRVRETGGDTRLLPGVVVAPSALDQVVKRIAEGWSYLRV
jgi:hypothetical protein